MEEKSHALLAHELIDTLEKYGKDESRKLIVLKKAMEEILTIGVNTRDRNRMLNCAFHSLAEIEDGYENMTIKEKNNVMQRVITEARERR